MFLATFGLGKQVLTTIEEKKKKNPIEFLEGDQRGKHKKRGNKIAKAVVKSIMRHIRQFPKMDSHYCRQSTQREYLEDSLNINKMFKLFTVWKEAGIDTSKVKPHFYRQIFTSKFNLYFHRPKKDLCSECSKFDALPAEEKAIKRNEYDKHVEDKDIARAWLAADVKEAKKNKTIFIGSFDLQKVLPLPRSHTSAMFYNRKISLFDFTIFDHITREGFCHVWTEVDARRGADEIASCLWRFIKNKADKKFKDLRFYSDNCAGQNCNQYVFTMYVKAAMEFNVTITHRFLVKGHTESPGDSMHSTIERAISKKALYTADEYCREMETCKNKEPYYNVHQMQQGEMYDFTSLSQSNFWKKMNVSQLCEIKFYPNKKIEYRYDYESPNVESKYIPQGKDKEKKDLIPCYTEKLALDSKKIVDLEKLMQYIPAEHHNYYKQMMY